MAPRLTVIVPVHDVEPWLEACLNSLAGQTLGELEVVVVDDGSTDGTAAVARQFAAADERFRVVEREHAGPGAARNAGVRAARADTEFLAFADGDDVVPEDAYARLLAALDESGSDLAVGNVLRLRTNGELRQSTWLHRPARSTRLASHITRDPLLRNDRTVCNKVFRRAFWDAHSLAFPEEGLDEALPVVQPAHHLAGSADVLSEPVYHWRERTGAHQAATQERRTAPEGIRDRVAAVRAVSGFLGGHYGERDPEQKRTFDRQALSWHLWPFVDALPRGDQEFQQEFLRHANDFADTVEPAVLAGLALDLRVKWRLVRERRLAELLELLEFEQDNHRAFAVRGLRRKLAQYPTVPKGIVPRELLTLGKRDLPLVSRLQEAVWQDGKLHLRGYAYVRNLPADAPHRALKTALLRLGRRRMLPLRVRTVKSPEATYQSRQDLHRYDRAGFEIVVDPRRLRTKQRRATWQLDIALLHGSVLRRGGLGTDGGVTAPAVHYLDDHTRVVPSLRKKRLQLQVENVTARLDGHRRDGDHVRLDGAVRTDEAGEQQDALLRLSHWHAESEISCPVVWGEHSGAAGEWRSFSARVPLAELEEARRVLPEEKGELRRTDPWGVRLVFGAGSGQESSGTGRGKGDDPESSSESFSEASSEGDDERRYSLAVRGRTPLGRYPLGIDHRLDGLTRELCVTVSAYGNVVLCDQTLQPVTDGAHWEGDDELVLEGSYPRQEGDGSEDTESVQLVLRHSKSLTETVLPVTLRDDRFHARVRPGSIPGPGTRLPLAEGHWYLFFRDRGATDIHRDAPVRLLPAEHNTLPLLRTVRGRDFTLERRFHDRLLLVSGSVLDPEDRGGYRQRKLRTQYAERYRERPLWDTVLYSSFDGRQFSDSPRAVYEELAARDTGLRHVWTVADQQAEIPAAAQSVTRNSTEWYEALARSRYIVTNGQLPDWFERREDQYVVQTWHGTPLKRIGKDLEGGEFSNPAYIASLAQRSRQWNLLVSPNSFSTPILRRAFMYDGEILESGYPRNDLLFSAQREQKAAAIREELGLPQDKRLVLYAPTWREDRPLGFQKYELDFRLDLEKAEKALGDDTVLLMRKHYMVCGPVPGAEDGGFVRDVTHYPDVAALMLISDVLVTDYSSLMFDFAQTGRPMFFYTYDLERYRDTLRGFYFDFEAHAPGPLVQHGEDLVEALGEPVRATAPHRDSYADFRRTFCDLDDGSAAAAVADRMLAFRPGSR